MATKKATKKAAKKATKKASKQTKSKVTAKKQAIPPGGPPTSFKIAREFIDGGPGTSVVVGAGRKLKKIAVMKDPESTGIVLTISFQ